MKEFTIDPEAFSSRTVHSTMSFTTNLVHPETRELLAEKGKPMKCTSSADHEDFEFLREQLGSEGFIHIQRNCWNGDRVLKPFLLNKVVFLEGETFSCAAALKYKMGLKLKRI